MEELMPKDQKSVTLWGSRGRMGESKAVISEQIVYSKLDSH